MLIITDLDGTLRDSSHRDGLIIGQGWNAFYAAGADDPPIEPMCNLIVDLYRQGHTLEIWTGTPENHLAATVLWLTRNLGLSAADFFVPADSVLLGRGKQPSPIMLLMRAEGDTYRSANTIKGEWLEQYREDWGALPDLVFDDRADCVAWWRSFGITCLDVAGHGY